MIAGRLLNKIINIFTGLFAMATLILMLLWCLNTVLFKFLPDETLASINTARNYCTLATIFCAGTEFTLRRSILLAGIFAAIVLAVAAFMVYADVVF